MAVLSPCTGFFLSGGLLGSRGGAREFGGARGAFFFSIFTRGVFASSSRGSCPVTKISESAS
jgi:hypothetical protein